MSDNATNSKVPGWLWLLAGVLLGALVMFLMRLSEIDPSISYLDVLDKPQSSEPDTEAGKGHRFDFYKLLRDTEVPVTATPATPSAKELNTEYLLQVASFQSAADADSVRAELVILNLDAWVEKSQAQSGTVWHRVIVGPFQNRSAMANAKSKLLSNRYEALMLKRQRAE